LGGADPNAEAIDDAADNQHGNVLRGGDDDAADDPDHGADPDVVQSKCTKMVLGKTYMIARLRPRRSERKPERSDANQEPAAMEAVIPP
jgi:hypothetical protein